MLIQEVVVPPEGDGSAVHVSHHCHQAVIKFTTHLSTTAGMINVTIVTIITDGLFLTVCLIDVPAVL